MSDETNRPQQFGDRLRGFLADSGKSQVTVAQLAGIDRADLNRIINNKRPPRADEIQALAKVFDKPPAELVADIALPERAAKALAAFADLETQALEFKQRAEAAEATLMALQGALDEERDAALAERLQKDAAYRAELTRLRIAHQDELVRVRQAHASQLAEMQAIIDVMQREAERQAAENYQVQQKMALDLQRERVLAAQRNAALVSVQGQNVDLRKQLSSQAGTAAATAVFGGLAGLLLGVGVASK